MLVPQRTQYAVRAVFELAKRNGEGPTRIGDVAEAQAIPHRFLEVILGQLRRGGFVASQRGNEGGYSLVRSPETLTVGEVIRHMQGPLSPVGCAEEVGPARTCKLRGGCVFMPLWDDVEEAISGVIDARTFQDLLDEEKRQKNEYVANYDI